MRSWEIFTLLVGQCALGQCERAYRGHDWHNGLSVATTSGIVQGILNGTTPSVRQFLGIPFAQPPVGELRFAPPVPLESSNRTIDATRFSPACPQYESASPSVYSEDVRELLILGSTSEDCLTLSIWTPSSVRGNNYRHRRSGLPVFVWIYGGGFQTGGSDVPYQNPSEWVQRTQDHIIVSLQYRLNIFGFPNAAGLQTSQNPGLLDQRAALEWIRDNIAAFGGDPSRMVLWGQSAGASSVDYQNFAYPDNPIVNGFIANSGSVFLGLTTSDFEQTNFSFVAQQVGCSPDLDAAGELACMRNVSSDRIITFVKDYGDSGQSPGISFLPVPDETLVFSNYTERYAQGALSSAPAIFGSTNNEGISLIPYDPNGPNQTLADAVTVGRFLCPAVRSSVLREAVGRTTYRYEYRGNFSDISPRSWLGAYHSSELPLIFGTIGQFRGPATPFEEATSNAMQDLWVNFAQSPAEPEGWASYSEGEMLIFGDDNEPVQQVGTSAVDARCT